MKKFRKLIPALALLLVSAVLMSTASYAWFSMNNKVTVTGMEVKTKVSDNLFVAKTTLDATDHVADSNYKSFINDMTPSETLLEPVSTVDGKSFFYTDTTTNVAADGAPISSSAYIVYSAGDAFDKMYGVDSVTSSPDAVGYVDYVLELKAVNGSGSDKEVRLTALNLTYKGIETNQKAFRVAVFMQKLNGAYTMVSEGTLGTAQLFAYTDSAYFDSKAVSAVDTVSAVTLTSTGVVGTVTAGKTDYFKVVVRLWLEGQDTTCNNDTFASLTKNWALDLAFELGTETTATKIIGRPAIAATNAGVNLTDGKLSNGETPASYVWYIASTGAAAGVTTKEAPSAEGTYYCIVTTTKGNQYVTNNVTITP